jgi:hypothetical protein
MLGRQDSVSQLHGWNVKSNLGRAKCCMAALPVELKTKSHQDWSLRDEVPEKTAG